jgi:carbon storage regulator
MLVLSRKTNESIMIGDNIEIVVIGVEGDAVRIGIRAPKEIEVFRKEVYISIQQSNEEAVKSSVDAQTFKQLLSSRQKES